MKKEKKRRLLSYLFLVAAVLTSALAYTIETWRWGGLALGVGLLFIAILTWIAFHSGEEGGSAGEDDLNER